MASRQCLVAIFLLTSLPEVFIFKTLKFFSDLSQFSASVDHAVTHRIHVWYMYLHLFDSYGFHAGKYTMDPMGSYGDWHGARCYHPETVSFSSASARPLDEEKYWREAGPEQGNDVQLVPCSWRWSSTQVRRA